MKSPFSFLPSTRFVSGCRSCAVACCTFAVVVSVESASSATVADLTPLQLENLIGRAVMTGIQDWNFVLGSYFSGDPWYYSYPVDENQVNISWYLGSEGNPDYPYLFQILSFLQESPTNDISRLFPFLSAVTNEQRATQSYLYDSSAEGSSFSVGDSLGAVQRSLANLGYRFDSHGYEVLVAAPDIEDQLSDVVDSLGSVVYSLDNGIGVSVQGGQLSVDGQVDAYVVNWPDYFTGEYDSEVAGELTGYGQYETDWGATESDSEDLVQDSDDGVDDPAKIADVTNAVFSSGTVLSTNDVDKRLDVRERIFDTVGSQLLPENSLNRSFSSDVLILPAIPQFNLPRLEYSGSNSDVEDFLTRSGRMMGYFWDICFAVFLMFLVWREYEFYFRTI